MGDRKISGNAQARKWKALLVHGTILVDFDHELADQVLKYPPREPAYRRGRAHREFLVSLRALGVPADRVSVERAAAYAPARMFRGTPYDHDLYRACPARFFKRVEVRPRDDLLPLHAPDQDSRRDLVLYCWRTAATSWCSLVSSGAVA